MVGAQWRAVAVIGALAIILAGLATITRGTRWPVMSARFDRSGGNEGAGSPPVRGGSRVVTPPDQHNSATMWESLNRDVDPTLEGGAVVADPAAHADSLDGGTRT